MDAKPPSLNQYVLLLLPASEGCPSLMPQTFQAPELQLPVVSPILSFCCEPNTRAIPASSRGIQRDDVNEHLPECLAESKHLANVTE